jgi:putative methionine-R-sulfoxide reductase with GAF domain
MEVEKPATNAELMAANRRFARAERALSALSACNRMLIRATDEIRFLSDLCRLFVERCGYRMAWVGYLKHDAEKSIEAVAEAGFEAGYLANAGIVWDENNPRGRGPTGIAARTGEIQIAQDFMHDPRLALWQEQAKLRGYASSIALPLIDGAVTEGVLTIYAPEPDAFSSEEVLLLQEMAEDMAYGISALRIRRAQKNSAEKIQQGLEATLQALSAALELRDPYTAGHQRRVADLARAIAREMGLPEDEAHGVYLAGLVHDIGKIYVPAEILVRPRSLDKMEFALIKTHPQAGYDVLKDVEFPWPIAQAVLQHHERLDGSGYPLGLKGEAIILPARIIACADVVESMGSHRPYRPALGMESALAEIALHRGTLYDPAAVDACVGLVKGKGYAFPVR